METVLIIDSDEGRRDITQALQEAGFHVFEAADSVLGVSLMEQDLDVVIMSEEMPPVGDGGQELLLALRDISLEAYIIVLGSGDGQVAAQVLYQGADNYVRRPVNLIELVARVRAGFRRLREYAGR